MFKSCLRFVVISLFCLWISGSGQFGGAQSATSAYEFSKSGGFGKSSVVGWAKRAVQGYNMRVWLSNEMILGNQAAQNVSLVGLDYPAGTNTEHLFGGGPIIGGIVNGQRRVSSGYWEGAQEFNPELRDTARDRFWITSASDTLYDPTRPGYYKGATNIRGIDDDSDGKVDEDELDGHDNDGDWDLLNNDIGADGVPDSLEVGCNGPYNSTTNVDPANDNYDPTKLDACHPDAGGVLRRKDHRDRYTEKNRVPDHGEPHVDEDFGALSDHDMYCSATDTFSIPNISTLLPLGIKVWMKSFAWQGPDFDGILPIEYFFVNVGRHTIRNVYLGWTADMDVGPLSAGNFAATNYAGYLPEVRTAYTHNAVDRGSTPLGLTVLGSSRRLDSVNFVFRRWAGGATVSGDSLQYGWLNCEAFQPLCIEPDQPPSTPDDVRMIIAFGPLGDMRPGDTVKMAVALVSGTGITSGPLPMLENAKKAIRFYSGGFRPAIRPISPCLEIIPGFKKVTLKWGRTTPCESGRPGVDPMSIWDDSNHVADSYPPDHWRRINPPQGHVKGGRIFEGYRLYRSEDPLGSLNSFTLLKQFDIDDEFEYNAGLDTMFVDSNLVRGKRYWYTVTSFGIPDRTIIPTSPAPGITIYDTLYSGTPESPIESSRQSIDLTFSVSDRSGQVLVVPNPYRVDQDYTFENGGWEGRGADWTENNRRIKFIHLPKKCTIRVFTITGDQVTTLEHDDPVRGELDWDLLSETYRALASGVYIYSVESDLGRQIGKFVLIR